MTGPTLGSLLDEGVSRLEGAAAVPTGEGTEYFLDEVLFASCAGSAAEFRLRDEVGVAALRTPNATASARGPGWVRFAPRTLDGHTRDRALAWLESAWRRADTELSGLPGPDGDGARDDDADDDDADDDEDSADDDEDGADDDEGSADPAD